MELSGIYARGLAALSAAVLAGCEKDKALSPGPEPAAPARPKPYGFWRGIVPRFEPRPVFGG